MFSLSQFQNVQYQLAEEVENPLIHFTRRFFKLSLCLEFFLMWTLYLRARVGNGYAVSCCILCFSATSPPQRGKSSIAEGGDVARSGDAQGSEMSQSISAFSHLQVGTLQRGAP